MRPNESPLGVPSYEANLLAVRVNYMSRLMTKPTKMTAFSEDSDQPGHPPSLIRVFADGMKKAGVLRYSLSVQRRLSSDWADAHSHFVGFAMRQLNC